MARSLFIIDGHAQIYRAYFAPFAPLTSPTGQPTRAVHVFCTMLLNLLRNRRPDYLVVALDADESLLLRRQIYPEYKAHREPPPEDLGPQEEHIIAILAAAGVPLLRRTGYEADDLIATLVHRFRPPAGGGIYADEAPEITIVSRDKDLDQLLRPGVCLYDPLKDETVTAEGLPALKGWRPEQAIDAQILVGDSVDNVPGVPGIGPKTAARLLQQYGSLEGILAHAAELKPKQRENLLAFMPDMERTRRLVTLHTDVPLDFDLAQAQCARQRWDRARPILRELGLRRVLEQLPDGGGPDGGADQAAAGESTRLVAATSAPGDAAAGPAGGAAGSLRAPDGGDYRLVNTPEQFEALLADLARQPEFALDTETTSLSPVDCDLVGISLAWEVGRGYFIPVRSVYGPVLPLDLVRRRLGPLLRDPARRKIGQNLKYDMIVLRGAGIDLVTTKERLAAMQVLDAIDRKGSFAAAAHALHRVPSALTHAIRRLEDDLALTLFLRVAGAPLDNNLCEQSLKMVVLHRKNSLFYKTTLGAFVGDLFMTLIYTCRQMGVNPFDYLTTLLRYHRELSKDPGRWLPWSYKHTVEAQPP